MIKSYFEALKRQHEPSLLILGQIFDQKQSTFKRKIEQGSQLINQKLKIQPANTRAKNNQVNRMQYLQKQYDLSLKIKQLSLENKPNFSSLSEIQRVEFSKKMKKQQQQLQKHRQQKIRDFYEKIKQAEEELQTKKNLQFESKKEQKRLEIEKKLEELNVKKQKRQQSIKHQSSILKNLKQSKKLFDKMQEKFKQNESIMIKQQHEKLSLLKQQHRLLPKSQYLDHMNKIKEFKKQKQSLKNLDSNKSAIKSERFYKSHWYKSVKQQQKIVDSSFEDRQRKQALKQLKDRQKKYAEYIKHNHMPDTDQKLIQQLNKRHKSPIKRKSVKQITQMGLNNLKVCKEKAAKVESKEKKDEKVQSGSSIKKINYLEQLKQEKIGKNSLDKNTISNYNKSVFKDKQQAKMYIEKIEEEASRKQKLLKTKSEKAVNFEVNHLIMKALDAKRQVLKFCHVIDK